VVEDDHGIEMEKGRAGGRELKEDLTECFRDPIGLLLKAFMRLRVFFRPSDMCVDGPEWPCKLMPSLATDHNDKA
jgi:hypothetical protein